MIALSVRSRATSRDPRAAGHLEVFPARPAPADHAPERC